MLGFNPRARKERDNGAGYVESVGAGFNPRARKERDTAPS